MAQIYIGSKTDSDGNFSIILPPFGDQYVRTDIACDAPNTNFGDAWWDGITGSNNPDDATAISLDTLHSISTIHFKLVECNTDADGDGTPDCNDICPNDPQKTAPGINGCGNPEPTGDDDDGGDCGGIDCFINSLN